MLQGRVRSGGSYVVPVSWEILTHTIFCLQLKCPLLWKLVTRTAYSWWTPQDSWLWPIKLQHGMKLQSKSCFKHSVVAMVADNQNTSGLTSTDTVLISQPHTSQCPPLGKAHSSMRHTYPHTHTHCRYMHGLTHTSKRCACSMHVTWTLLLTTCGHVTCMCRIRCTSMLHVTWHLTCLLHATKHAHYI